MPLGVSAISSFMRYPLPTLPDKRAVLQGNHRRRHHRRQMSSEPLETRPDGRPVPEVAVGAKVKVGRRNERFWCQVARVNADGTLATTVDNFLERNPDLQYGQALEVGMQHVLEVASREDDEAFLEAVRRAASAGATDPLRVGAMQWVEARLGGGIAHPLHPNAMLRLGDRWVDG